MNSKTVFFTLFTLLAGTAILIPNAAFAERGDGNRGDRQQQSQREHRGNHQATNPQRIERQRPQHIERPRPQRFKRQERREHKPAIVQPRFYDHRYATSPRRHVETRRSFHIERSHRGPSPRYYHRAPRNRYYRGIHIYRRYGYLYPGFGYYYSDRDAFRWLAFTALTLAITNNLDEHQQRMQEQALIRATSAAVGDTLYWDDRYASGSVTVLHIGTDFRGHEYREFRQTVNVRGRTETSYGSAYLKSNGTWAVRRTS